MRATCEIVADVKDGKEVSYEELKMACIVQSSLLFFFQQDIKALIKGDFMLRRKRRWSILIRKHLLLNQVSRHGTGRQCGRIHSNG